IGVVVRDEHGVVVAASCWQVLPLPDSEVAEALAMRKGLEFAKDMSFLNLIAESDASNMILALNHHQQSSYYVVLLKIVVILMFVVYFWLKYDFSPCKYASF
ncbi:hypothetical protein A2U01_0056379, partial [Trifolium medium]|nr:hypothetical protein [Trifolium medium]